MRKILFGLLAVGLGSCIEREPLGQKPAIQVNDPELRVRLENLRREWCFADDEAVIWQALFDLEQNERSLRESRPEMSRERCEGLKKGGVRPMLRPPALTRSPR